MTTTSVRTAAGSWSQPEEVPKILTYGVASAADPSLSFDGKKIIFSAKRSAQEKWNIWEMEKDGTGIRQITRDFGNCREPHHLATTSVTPPEFADKVRWITFTSDVADTLDEQSGGVATALYALNTEPIAGRGTVVRRSTFNLSSDFCPTVLGDGRVLFTSCRPGEGKRQTHREFPLLVTNWDGSNRWCEVDNNPEVENSGKRKVSYCKEFWIEKDWMAQNPVTITVDTSMIKAIHLIKERRFRRLPVVAQGKLEGMVTDRDLKEASPSKATTLDVHELYYLLAELQVKDIMTRNPVTVLSDDTVERAAQLMLENTISGLPVVDDKGMLAGIITQSDIFRAFMHISGIQQGGVQSALRLPDQPGLIKEVVDPLRARGARFVSLLTSYTTSREGYRDVYIRVKNLTPASAKAAQEELASRYDVLYVLEAKE